MDVDAPPEAPARLRHVRHVQAPALVRPVQGRLLSGVAAGVARHLGLEAWQVRLGFVALALAGGAGVVAYGLLWVLVRQDDTVQTAAETLRTAAARGRPDAQAQAVRTLEQVRRATHDSEPVRLLLGGLALCVVAAFLVAGRLGVSLPWPWLLPVLVVIAGAVLALSQLDTSERTRWLEPVGIRGTGGLVRLLGGLLLVTAGAVMLLEPDLDVQQVTLVVIAALAVLVGIALVLGPWALRLWRDLEKERGLREREQERAEIAAHLHDSVLHTLSLIQRRPGDAEEVVRLARAQERQLREWLYSSERPAPDADETVSVAVRRACAEVEDGEGVAVEVVVVGDAPVDPHTAALVKAMREALLNAARHGRVGVSVYVECTADEVEAFVRDRGPGFDLESGAAGPAGRARVGDRQDGAPRRHREAAPRAGRWHRGDAAAAADGAPGPHRPPRPHRPHRPEGRPGGRTMTEPTVRVLLVDDHRLFRSGVRSELLDADAGLDVVEEAGDVDAAITAVARCSPTSCSSTCTCRAVTAAAARRCCGSAPPPRRRAATRCGSSRCR